MAGQFSAIFFIRNANGKNAKAGRATAKKPGRGSHFSATSPLRKPLIPCHKG
jgi:hypothetical protein